MTDCVFCEIVAGRAPATVVDSSEYCLAIVPRDPVVPGHVLVLPREHAEDAASDENGAADAMRMAARLARQHDAYNIITSGGKAEGSRFRWSTQSIRHTHLHVVPRRPGDRLWLPWSFQLVKRALCKLCRTTRLTRIEELQDELVREHAEVQRCEAAS